MANRTVKDAKSIRGTNPQYLVEKIIRSRIYDSRYWKEECFALTAELMVDKAMELRYVGGVYGGNIKPSPFLCLILKMLQIQPEKDIIVEFIKNEEFKYVRVLGAFYMRLVGTSLDCYKYLEPLLNDYRKLRRQNRLGQFELVHVDEFIDELLREDRICDVILPRLQKRHVLEENNETEPRVSALDDDLDEGMESDEEGELDAGVGDMSKKGDSNNAMANGNMGMGSNFMSSGNTIPSLLKSRESGGNQKAGDSSALSSGAHRHHHHHHHGGAALSNQRQPTKDKGRKPSPAAQNRQRRSRSRERDMKERDKRHRSRERERPSDKRDRKWDANQSWERRHHRSRSKSPAGGRTHRHRDEDHGRNQHNARDNRSGKDWNSARGERDRHGGSGNRHRSDRNSRTGRRSDSNEVVEANALRAKLGLPPLRH